MERIYKTLALDFNSNASLEIVDVQQGDHNGRMIKLELYTNGQRVTLYDSDRATLNASCGGVITAIGQSCQIIDNVVYVPITEDLTSIPGIEHCVVRIDGAQGRTHTARFDLNVGIDPANEGVPAIISTADFVKRLATLEDECVRSSTVRTIETPTENEYKEMTDYDPNTLYCILEATP